MTTETTSPTSDQTPTAAAPSSLDAHRRTPDEVAVQLGVDPATGLATVHADRRRERHGRNELEPAEVTPAWRRLAAQFADPLILILLAAAAIALVVSGEVKTPVVVLFVVVLNAVIGFVQENRAERSLEALRAMIGASTRVRRDGAPTVIDTRELVPGDVVLLEAGDRVPADGRLIVASALEIEEAALTGESQPAEKSTNSVDRDAVPIGDRTCIAYMNTQVTRGRAEMIVTATGMQTEIGRIAGLLRATAPERSPLQRQLDRLARNLAVLAGVIVAIVAVIGLLRGESASDVILTGVALAVAAIPEGLPAVTAVTLALGVGAMARRHAIVKRLAAVETLGCTSVICSDKTGTLTLNEMTAVELITQLVPHRVTGTGYAPEGTIERHAGDEPTARDTALTAMALCSDASLREEQGWHLVGDPTEGALVTLAAKGGVDVAAMRVAHPRLAEVPFDSANKYMATVHEMVTGSGDLVVRLIAKGAPDVLLTRSTSVIDRTGMHTPISLHHDELVGHNERLAAEGLRVLAVAIRDLTVDAWHEFAASGAAVESLVDSLTLVALVGIVDPPRPEARDAIAVANSAGITVRMITGDHPSTAASIGRQLGLTGESVTGADLDRMDDAELDRRLDDIGVFARVAPEHKLRLVTAFQRAGHVVAMTGDGVNDAPALKKADIGVAMGITGTEVSKEAATMVLTDDNFATIVGAVERGRAIYANIVSFVRFQLSTTLGFALVFLLAAVLGIADGKPFAAIAILWVNIIMDGPPAMALGVDPVDRRAMGRPPRPRTEAILTPARWTAVGLSAAVMAIGTIAVLHGTDAAVAGTVAFNTFVIFQFFNILNARHDTRTVFDRATLRNRWLWISLASVIILQIGVTHLGPLQSLFDTTSMDAGHWLLAVGVASTVVWVEELRKFIARRTSLNPLVPHEGV